MTIEDVQAIAWNVVALTTPKKKTPNTDSAIYKYWVANKDVGTPMTAEMALDDNTTAMVTSTGRVLHWLGGDDVEVL